MLQESLKPLSFRIWLVAKLNGADAVVSSGVSNGTDRTAHACSAASPLESRTLSAGVPLQMNSPKDAAVTRNGKEEE